MGNKFRAAEPRSLLTAHMDTGKTLCAAAS
jgi:hypothetical protein